MLLGLLKLTTHRVILAVVFDTLPALAIFSPDCEYCSEVLDQIQVRSSLITLEFTFYCKLVSFGSPARRKPFLLDLQ